MSPGRERYASVNELWAAQTAVAITRAEAEAAARRLFRAFGKRDGYPQQRRDAKLGRVRRCWIAAQPTHGIVRGWARLVHDVSHQIFRARYPKSRPHHPLHAKLELEMAEHVLAEGWLGGLLKPAPKPGKDTRALKLARCEASIKRWESKLRRAQNALRKLRRQHARLVRVSHAGR